MQAMPSIVEADRRCHHASGDAQMGRLFPDDALVLNSTLMQGDTVTEKESPSAAMTSHRLSSEGPR